MPNPSPTLIVAGVLEHYVFENPWPAALVCLVAGLAMGWRALREGHRPTLHVAIAALALAATLIALGSLVTTNGERGKAVVAELVSRAEKGDIPGILALLAPHCTLHYGRPQNPGSPRPEWEATVGLLQGRYAIADNSVTRLVGESESGNVATVELSCLTTISAAPYPTPSAWWLRVAQQPDGAWRIERIACLRIGKQSATPGMF